MFTAIIQVCHGIKSYLKRKSIRPAGGTQITQRPHLLSFLDLPLLVKLFQMCLCHTPEKRPNKTRGWERSQVGKRFSLEDSKGKKLGDVA